MQATQAASQAPARTSSLAATAAAAAAPSGATRRAVVLPRRRPAPALSITRSSSASSRHNPQPWQQDWQQRCATRGVRCTAAAGSDGADPQPATPSPAALVLSSSDDEPVPPYSSGGSSGAGSSSSSNNSAATSYASGGEGSDSDGSVKIDLQLPRRSLLVLFTCNICGNRSERLVNPVAWQKGMVSGCTGGASDCCCCRTAVAGLLLQDCCCRTAWV
mgnify:CR=1 FL=1